MFASIRLWSWVALSSLLLGFAALAQESSDDAPADAAPQAKPVRKAASKLAAKQAAVKKEEEDEPDDAEPKPAAKKKAAAKKAIDDESDDVESRPAAKKAAPKEEMDEEPQAKPATKKGARPVAKLKAAEPVKPAERPVGPSGEPMLPPGKPSASDNLLGASASIDDSWRLLDRDLEYGSFDDAKIRLEQLLASKELTPTKVVELREKYGSAALVRMELRPELRQNARKLIDMANEGSRALAREQKRLNGFVAQLQGSASERQYAIDQLRRAGSYAVPALVSAYQQKTVPRPALMDGFFGLDPSTWPAIATLLDSGEEDLMGVGVDVLRFQSVPKSAEFLWFAYAEPQFTRAIRKHAGQTLAYLTNQPVDRLPRATTALNQIAESYYRRESGLRRGPASIEVWQWKNGLPTPTTASIAEAEEYYGIKFARQALALDPLDETAKVILFSIALQVSADRLGMDQSASPGRDNLEENLLAAGPHLLSLVLNKAIVERRTAVVLGALRALGQVGNTAHFGLDRLGEGSLIKAINYPDPRVQLAAATAILHLHPEGRFPLAPRVVETLLRSLNASSAKTVLVIDSNTGRANLTGQQFSQLGYTFESAASGKAGFKLASESGSVDLIVIEPTVHNWDLDQTLANLKGDARTAGIPIVVLEDEKTAARRDQLQKRFPGLVVAPKLEDVKKLGRLIEIQTDDVKPLTSEEKTSQQLIALDWLVRLARGEFPQVEIKPAVEALSSVLTSPELGPRAAEALSYLPGAEVQRKLATGLLNPALPPTLRIALAEALARNMQRSSAALDSSTRTRIIDLLEKTEDPVLRSAIARLVGLFSPGHPEVAKRLQQLRSTPVKPAPTKEAAPPAKPAEKKTAAKKAVEEPSEDEEK